MTDDLVIAGALALIGAGALSCALAVGRLIAGPTNADRIVALDILLAAAVAICVAASLMTGRTVFLDVGLGVALTGFVGTIGWARAVERGMPTVATEDRSSAEDRP